VRTVLCRVDIGVRQIEICGMTGRREMSIVNVENPDLPAIVNRITERIYFVRFNSSQNGETREHRIMNHCKARGLRQKDSAPNNDFDGRGIGLKVVSVEKAGNSNRRGPASKFYVSIPSQEYYPFADVPSLLRR
jgi:hypothetical protein